MSFPSDMTAPPAGALEACPCCGGEAATSTARTTDRDYIRLNKRDTGYGVNCISCGLTNRGIAIGYATEADAIAAWNRRTDATALRLREGWRPIESAPKEVDVLVYMRGAAIPTRVAMLCPVRSDSDEHRWLDTGCNALTDMFEVAAWMPLPAPPTADDLARILEEGE